MRMNKGDGFAVLRNGLRIPCKYTITANSISGQFDPEVDEAVLSGQFPVEVILEDGSAARLAGVINVSGSRVSGRMRMAAFDGNLAR